MPPKVRIVIVMGHSVGAIVSSSAEVLESGRGSTLDGPVPVGHCGGVGPRDQGPGLLGVARATAFGEHPPPGEVGPGGEGLRTHPVIEFGGLGEVGIRFVVAAKDSSEAGSPVRTATSLGVENPLLTWWGRRFKFDSGGVSGNGWVGHSRNRWR